MNKIIYLVVLLAFFFVGIVGYLISLFGVYDFFGGAYFSFPACLILLYVLRVYLLSKYFLDLASIFLISLTIFFAGRIIGFAVLGVDQFLVQSLTYVVLPRGLMDRIAFTALISVSVFLCFESGLRVRSGDACPCTQVATNFRWYRLGRVCFLASIPLMLVRMYYELKHIQQVGYLSIYVDGLKGVDYPFSIQLVTLTYYVFISGYYLIVGARTSYRSFLLYSSLFLMVSFFDSLKGGRANIAIPFLFVIWWSYHGYGKRVSLVAAVCAALVAATLFGALGASRFGDDIDIAAAALSFIASQGNSPIVMALREIYAVEFNDYSQFSLFSNLFIPYYYIFYPGVFDLPQSEVLVNTFGGFKHVLTYVINSEYYLAGGGVGSFYLAELHEFGIFGVILGSLLMGVCCRWFSELRQSGVFGFFSYFVFGHLFLLPRAEFFPNLWAVIKLYLIFLFLTRILLNVGLRRLLFSKG